jgi:hypothetical protein
MKRSLILKILFLAVIITLCIVTSVQAEVNKQYIEVTLKSGEVLRFEYRSFIEANIPLLPEKKPDSPDEVSWFGSQRLLFQEKDSCELINIGLDNLRELEVIGIDFNPCSQKKGWLFKVNLLALDKYVGFFQIGESNIGKALAEHGAKGQLLDQSETKTVPFEDIEKISLFSR